MKLKERLAIGYIRTKFKLLAAVSRKKAARQAFELFCTPLIKPIKDIPPVFETAEPLQFKLNELKVQGYRWQHPRSKKILVLHGFSSAASKFEQYIKALIKKGYEVIAFDAPAHGNSEGKTIHAGQYKDMIEKVIELYGPINGFVAHSFGGIALSLALEETAHDEHTKVVFLAPATETVSAVDQAFELLRLTDPEVRKEFDNIIYSISSRPTAWFSIKRAMQNIKAKILWIHDEDDDITPLSDALKVKEQKFPNIEFMITKGLGHRKIYRDNEVKKLVTDFL